jgi:membrane-associated phospholipid phosphatase
MPVANTSNTSNTSGLAMAHAGQPSSTQLSRSLLASADRALEGVDFKDVKVPNPWPVKSDAQIFRSLHPKHRTERIITALVDGITITKPVKDTDGKMNFTVSGAACTVDTSPDYWTEQLKDVLAARNLRGARNDELVLQQSDIISYLALPVRLGPVTHPWTMAYLAAVHEAVVRLGAVIKGYFDFPRPEDLSAYIMPSIQTPAHSAFPSGHAMESWALATVLAKLYPHDGVSTALDRLADRVTNNRVIAGVHFPVDGEVGQIIGRALGDAFYLRLQQRPSDFPILGWLDDEIESELGR